MAEIGNRCEKPTRPGGLSAASPNNSQVIHIRFTRLHFLKINPF